MSETNAWIIGSVINRLSKTMLFSIRGYWQVTNIVFRITQFHHGKISNEANESNPAQCLFIKHLQIPRCHKYSVYELLIPAWYKMKMKFHVYYLTTMSPSFWPPSKFQPVARSESADAAAGPMSLLRRRLQPPRPDPASPSRALSNLVRGM